MNIILIALTLNLIVLGLLGLRFWRMRRELAELRARSERLAGVPAVPADLGRMAREGAALLLVHILNPMELAAQKHWAAGMAGRLTPGIVRKIVCREAARIVSQELPKFGVVAEVRVIAGG